MEHIVVMGVAGAGKSTVARALADRTGWPFAEGDELHPPANVTKMRAGEPLTDDDRQPWLERVRAWMDERGAAGESTVVACSALRRRYRDVLRGARGSVRFVLLTADTAELRKRIGAREGHFMPASLLASQLATLEPLARDERGMTLDASLPVDALVDDILRG
ncbi:gluconokinase [Microbacterium sp. NPDC096154]|uniref:gluconokinase n=1 Tax=Microbacterium sp. NPDC096154 TaxID=3155549 RepID=UPI00332A806C